MKQPILSNRIDKLNEGKYNEFLRSISPNPDHTKLLLKKLKWKLYLTDGCGALLFAVWFYAVVWTMFL